MASNQIEMPNLYEINKVMIKQSEKPMDAISLSRAIHGELLTFLQMKEHKYFMLLCNDLKDYTVFVYNPENEKSTENFKSELFCCLNNRGKIYSLEIDKSTNEAIEIWVEVNGNLYCYYLFGYDNGVIEL